MKSKSSFPISERLKNGKFKKSFTQESFKEVYEILIHYHQALNEVEKEIEENNLDYNIDEIFPKEKRLPLDNMVYIGMGKLPYFHFVNSVEKYHNALHFAEKFLQKNNI
jgi:hypothetical protein